MQPGLDTGRVVSLNALPSSLYYRARPLDYRDIAEESPPGQTSMNGIG
jgi:hypothetical protein